MDGFNPDILRTMQQAMELSKMFGAGAQSPMTQDAGSRPETERNSGNTEDGSIDKNDEARNIGNNDTMEDKMKQIVNMMNFMQQMQSMTSAQGRPVQPDPPKPRQRITRQFDGEIHTPALSSIKAAIPHLDSRYRRYMSIFVKLIEIQKMMELYSQAAVQMCSGDSADDWQHRMLEALRSHMDDDKANKIDLLLKMMEVKEIMGRMQKV